MLRQYYAAAVLILFAGVVVLSGCLLQHAGGAGFTVFYSNDVLGEFENCGCDDSQLGGLSRKARVFRTAAVQAGASIRLDAGNLFFKKKPANDIEAREFLLKADYILAAYNRMGCDGLNVSDGDLMLGLDALLALRGKASFPFVSSNIVARDSGQPVFQPALLLTAGALRVAVLGLCPENAAVGPRARIEDPVTAARAMVATMREKSDYIIVLSGLGPDRDRALPRLVPGINLIVSTHADRLQNEAVMESGTAIVQSYRRGQYLGRVDITCSARGFAAVQKLLPLTPDVGEEQDIADLGRAYKAQVAAMNKQEFFKQHLSQTGSGGSAVYLGAETCLQCHAPQYDNWKATPHARAYQTLVDKGSEFDVECLSCHTTGYGEPGGYGSDGKERSAMSSVQCESCHGPGSMHDGTKKGTLRNGGSQLCLGCHNEKNSPRFDYAEYVQLIACPVGMDKK